MPLRGLGCHYGSAGLAHFNTSQLTIDCTALSTGIGMANKPNSTMATPIGIGWVTRNHHT